MSNGKQAEAVSHARHAATLKPDDAEAISLLGLCLVGEDVTREEGFEHLRHAVKMEPAEPRWQVNLGQGLTKTARFVDAEKAFAAAAELSGGNSALLMQWGKSLRLAGRPAEASQVYARVIQRKPSNTAWLAASEALSEAGDFAVAAIAYEKAFPEVGRPDYAAAHLADAHMELGNYDKAKRLNDSLRIKNPESPDTGLRAVNLMRLMGDRDETKAVLATLWGNNPAHGGIAAALLRGGDPAPRALAESIAKDETADQNQRRDCAFALCDFADKAGETDAAWAWAVLANSLYPDTLDPLASLRSMLDKAVAVYKLMPVAQESAALPATKMLYIIGPLHSGGSLLQTTLAAHSSARSVGERGGLLSLLLPLLDDPKAFAEQLRALASADIAGMTRSFGMSDFFVDKTPHYFLLAGLLGKVHTGAQFISPHREVNDMAVSLFFHDFGTEFPYARTLAGIQEYLNFHDAALVRWREAGVKIITHNHNRFVKDPERRGKALCGSLGLTWSEDMLAVQAASTETVTISAGERYARHLVAAGFNA